MWRAGSCGDGGGEHRTKGQPGMGTLRRETLEECGGRTGDHHMGEGLGLGMVAGEGGCLGGRELWAMWARGRSRRKRMSQGMEAQERASPVPSSFTMPSPSALFCLSKALRSRTLGERKMGEDGLRPLPHSSRALQHTHPPPYWAESHSKPCMS